MQYFDIMDQVIMMHLVLHTLDLAHNIMQTCQSRLAQVSMSKLQHSSASEICN